MYTLMLHSRKPNRTMEHWAYLRPKIILLLYIHSFAHTGGRRAMGECLRKPLRITLQPSWLNVILHLRPGQLATLIGSLLFHFQEHLGRLILMWSDGRPRRCGKRSAWRVKTASTERASHKELSRPLTYACPSITL